MMIYTLTSCLLNIIYAKTPLSNTQKSNTIITKNTPKITYYINYIFSPVQYNQKVSKYNLPNFINLHLRSHNYERNEA